MVSISALPSVGNVPSSHQRWNFEEETTEQSENRKSKRKKKKKLFFLNASQNDLKRLHEILGNCQCFCLFCINKLSEMMNQVTKLEAQDVLNYYNLVHIWTVTFNFQEISIIFNVFFFKPIIQFWLFYTKRLTEMMNLVMKLEAKDVLNCSNFISFFIFEQLLSNFKKSAQFSMFFSNH